MPRALFSLYDVSEVESFAKSLHNLGWEIISTKETTLLLDKAGMPSTSVEEFVGITDDYGIPPTLHPKIEQALTGQEPDSRIDLVYDLPYPLEKGNDVGGHTLLALAVKGNRTPVMAREDMRLVIQGLEQSGAISEDLRRDLISKASARIAEHYISVLRQKGDGDGVAGIRTLELLNGENPYQIPSYLFAASGDGDELAIHRFRLLRGEAPCFTNVADLDCILHTLCLACEAFNKSFGKVPHLAVAAKHGNACGLAADWQSPGAAAEKALSGNMSAIWGGELIVNFPIDETVALLLYESREREKKLGNKAWMLDVIAAPSFSKEALNVLGRKQSRKLFENSQLSSPGVSITRNLRQVRGGFLCQPSFGYVLDFDEAEKTSADFTDEDRTSLILAWATAWSSSLGGNEIAIVKDGQLIGTGGGPSTVAAARNAVIRAREEAHSLENAAFAADAFFPYTDAPQVLIDGGCSLGLVPKGGVREQEVRGLFKSENVRMCFLPEQFRGFCRH